MARGYAREGKWSGNWRMEWVASTFHTTSEHGVLSITTADAHTSAVSSRLNWRPRRFKWTRPFRRKTKSGFCACAITFQTQSTTSVMTKSSRSVSTILRMVTIAKPIFCRIHLQPFISHIVVLAEVRYVSQICDVLRETWFAPIVTPRHIQIAGRCELSKFSSRANEIVLQTLQSQRMGVWCNLPDGSHFVIQWVLCGWSI
jgi:hypothetical protein